MTRRNPSGLAEKNRTQTRISLLSRAIPIGGILLLLLGLAAAWRWTDLGEWLAPDRLAAIGESLRQMPASPLLVLGAFVLGSVLVVPVTAMIVAVILVFGPWLGVAYALGGSLLGAAATYGIGRIAGPQTVRRIAGAHVDRLSRALSRRGILAVITIRYMPVAPFAVINLVAGTTHIGLRDFMVGTLVGMAPGIVAVAIFIDRVVAAMRDPGPATVAILVAMIVLVIAAMVLLNRSLRKLQEDYRVRK